MGLTRLKAAYMSCYSKLDKNDNPIDVFVYKITGSKSALERYEEVQGDNHRTDDDGNVLYFSTRDFGNINTGIGEVIITDNDKIAPNLEALKRSISRVKQAGGDYGQALAQALVAKEMGNAPVQQAAPSSASSIVQTDDEKQVADALAADEPNLG